MQDQTPWQTLDVLSPPARAIVEANVGSAYSRLVVRGDGWREGREMLARMPPQDLVKGKVHSPEDAQAMLAGLWLWHDWLIESHNISQKLSTPTGAFWHAIMHRREGDSSNAKYWYARCRHHPALALVHTVLATAAPTTGPLHGLFADAWDPDRFVDVVEAVHRKPDDPLHAVAIQLQQMEWQALFAHCAKCAAGMP